MISLIIALALSGLIIGALGRLIVPGPNPMSILMTILVGLGGAFLGGMVSRFAFDLRLRYSYGVGLLLSVIFSALLVVAFRRRHPRNR